MSNLNMNGVSPMQLLIERRRAGLSQIEAFTVKETRVHGFALVQDAGEVQVDVVFPVLFTEKPSMSFGGELDENQFVQERRFPTVSVVIISWAKIFTDRVGGGLNDPGWFKGASLSVVTTGKSDQRMWVHWQAEGKAVVDPTLTLGDTDGVL